VRLLLPADHRVRRFVQDDLGPFWSDRAMLLSTSVVSFCFHLVQITGQWAVGRALGLTLPLSYIAVFHPLVSAVASVPVTFSGIGIREGAYAYFLSQFGVDPSRAVAFGVLWLLVIISNSLVGGMVFLVSGARLPALRDPGRTSP
jgi:uncharacterized protein (TIRG00374 family)